MSNKDDYHYLSDNELEDAYRDSTFPDNDAREEMERRGYTMLDGGTFVKEEDEEEKKSKKRRDDDDDDYDESYEDDDLEEASGCFGCFAFLIVVAALILVAYILFKVMI